jgi:hypothetical protein
MMGRMMNHEVKMQWILTNTGYTGYSVLTAVFTEYNAMWSAESQPVFL